MSCDCCSSTATPPGKVSCPACGQPGEAVSTTTLLHQLTTPWQQPPGDEACYFCNHPDCTVVYFSSNGTRFGREALRQPPGQKSSSVERTLCYCFDIRFSDLTDPATARQCRDFVIQQTRNKVCACEQRNPSGRCCLRDFPKEEE